MINTRTNIVLYDNLEKTSLNRLIKIVSIIKQSDQQTQKFIIVLSFWIMCKNSVSEALGLFQFKKQNRAVQLWTSLPLTPKSLASSILHKVSLLKKNSILNVTCQIKVAHQLRPFFVPHMGPQRARVYQLLNCCRKQFVHHKAVLIRTYLSWRLQIRSTHADRDGRRVRLVSYLLARARQQRRCEPVLSDSYPALLFTTYVKADREIRTDALIPRSFTV